MTTKNETVASVEASMKSAMSQWQTATEAWSRMTTETMNANLQSATMLREQMGAMLIEGTQRAGQIAAKEQGQAVEALEAMQASARESYERFATAGRTAADTGRTMFDEAMKMADEQAKVVQAQARATQERATEWADQGIEALTNGPKAAKK